MSDLLLFVNYLCIAITIPITILTVFGSAWFILGILKDHKEVTADKIIGISILGCFTHSGLLFIVPAVLWLWIFWSKPFEWDNNSETDFPEIHLNP